MAKQLTISYKDEKYTLEFSRSSIKTMCEKLGFEPTDNSMALTLQLPIIFRGAFIMHHKNVSERLTDEIFSKITHKKELVGKLAEMLVEPVNTLMAEPEDSEGNANWAGNW